MGHDDAAATPPAGADDWFPKLYAELKRIAAQRMRTERKNHTLSATALVNEAYVKLSPRHSGWGNPEEFYAAASRAMREILCDHARGFLTQERGGDAQRVALAESVIICDDPREAVWDLLDLEAVLEELAAIDSQKAQAVELRLFAGLTHAEVAQIQGLTVRAVEADWYLSRDWLAERLGDRRDGDV